MTGEQRTNNNQRTAAWVVFGVYLAVLLTLTFLPLGGIDRSAPVDIHLVLGGTIRLALRQGVGSHELAVAIGNLVAFAPLGVLVPILARKRSALLVFAVAFVLSSAIELGQLAVSVAVGFGYRAADVDDVVVNVCGALIGYAAYLLFVALRTLVERGRKSWSRRS